MRTFLTTNRTEAMLFTILHFTKQSDVNPIKKTLYYKVKKRWKNRNVNVFMALHTMDTSKSMMDTLYSIVVYNVSIVSKSDGKHSSYHTKWSDVNPIKKFLLWSKSKSSYFVQCINRLRCKKNIALAYIELYIFIF